MKDRCTSMWDAWESNCRLFTCLLLAGFSMAAVQPSSDPDWAPWMSEAHNPDHGSTAGLDCPLITLSLPDPSGGWCLLQGQKPRVPGGPLGPELWNGGPDPHWVQEGEIPNGEFAAGPNASDVSCLNACPRKGVLLYIALQDTGRKQWCSSLWKKKLL